MKTINYIFLTLGLLIIATGFTFLGLAINKIRKNDEEYESLFKNSFLYVSLSPFINILGFLVVALSLTFVEASNGKTFAILMSTLGSALFGFMITVGLAIFFLNYYHFRPKEKNIKYATLMWALGLIGAIFAAFIAFDGYAYLGLITFPLPRGIPLNRANPVVAFYAIFILTGALLSLAICEHVFYKKHKRHGVMENLFYVAFPSGIIGARIWYVIGNWTVGGFNEDFAKVFDFRSGGLAIMGGAIFGALGGMLFYYFKYRKLYKLEEAVDIVLPTLLVAQAVGRFGNFFNQEVYGAATDINNYAFLPYAIRQNMIIDGEFRVPLFFIEMMINLAGFFVIYFGIGCGLKKWRKPLDMGFAYFLWYGMTRAILEPLRDPSFNMGEKSKWSYIWALIFVGVSILGIVINHVWRHFASKQKLATNTNIEIKEIEEENLNDTKNEIKEENKNE
ncbi:MAG: prolipoprotein diacylglyceryl transferase [Bacilli bacterium]|jgi:prolipoprotein diacylglyceryl transferase